jgi:hypothetical protein
VVSRVRYTANIINKNAAIILTPGINISNNVRIIPIFPSGSTHQIPNAPNALMSIGST